MRLPSARFIFALTLLLVPGNGIAQSLDNKINSQKKQLQKKKQLGCEMLL